MATLDAVIQRGTHAARPAPGVPGALYFEDDTGFGYRDNGTSWDRISNSQPSSAFSIVSMTTSDVTLTQGNTLVLNSGAGHTATLPDAASATGQLIVVKSIGTSPATLACGGSDSFEDGRTSIPCGGDHGAIIVISTGTAWALIADLYNSTDWT